MSEPAAASSTGPRPLRVSGYHGSPTRAELVVVHFDRPQRVRRAAKGLAGFWGAMVVSVFIPVAHFVLVPSFFGIGIWQFFRRLRRRDLVRGAHAACPDCGVVQDFELGGGLRFPQGVRCRSCGRGLTIGQEAA
ncbi:MAG TPA: hypothetical protein VEH62_00080 [Gemmatimonadales bacterium]|nr:hypothetical protein [Gemmatimonadales bacterium]